MEKKHLLIITANTTAKIGMLSYLSSIFHNHLILESSRVSDVTPDLLAAADCLLYTTEAIRPSFMNRRMCRIRSTSWSARVPLIIPI